MQPLVDGGFSLQFSPLLEYREGQGLVLFCQLDVTGRTESDPVARTLVQNIIGYVAGWKPMPNRSIVYAGDPAGMRHLARAGFTATPFQGADLPPDQVLVAGPGNLVQAMEGSWQFEAQRASTWWASLLDYSLTPSTVLTSLCYRDMVYEGSAVAQAPSSVKSANGPSTLGYRSWKRIVYALVGLHVYLLMALGLLGAANARIPLPLPRSRLPRTRLPPNQRIRAFRTMHTLRSRRRRSSLSSPRPL